MTQLMRIVCLALLITVATGGLVWFGWALVHNLFVVVKLRVSKPAESTDTEEVADTPDAKAEAIS